jgi:DNA-binding NarL/FixJ family response regulator
MNSSNTTNSITPSLIMVDDHLIFRQGLKTILVIDQVVNVIGEASNGTEFIELLQVMKPDVVLMDIDMPQMDGMEATQKALELYPDLKIIALTMFGDEEYYYKMVDIGVKGFVLKTSGINEVEQAIKDILNGKSFFSNEILRLIIQNYSRTTAQVPPGKSAISVREKDILKHICLGLTTDEIAKALHISPKTVKSHRSNLLEKTACNNTASMIMFALRNKLVKV